MAEREAIRFNAGYQFNPYLYVGGGVGAEFQYRAYNNIIAYDNNLLTYPPPSYGGGIQNYTGTLVIVPIYGEIKGYLLKKPVSPFL